MVDMNQNEFGSTAGGGIAAPLSHFENRRFVPSSQPTYAPSDSNNDCQEGHSQAGYSQGEYSQVAYHSDGYGYYGYPQEYSQEYLNNSNRNSIKTLTCITMNSPM
jgi:hypothetical protein